MPLSKNLFFKLEELSDRYEEIERLLGDPEVISDVEQLQSLSKEYGELKPVAQEFDKYLRVLQEMDEANEMLEDDDDEVRSLVSETVDELEEVLTNHTETLQKLLIPKDPDDSKNVYLEIRAGTGGEEAALFVGDLKRMYQLYATKVGWNTTILYENPTGIGGFKQVNLLVEGKEVYSKLKFESGTHRVQRVPKTESQGRIHTSACTVAILAKSDGDVQIDIDKKDLRIDTYRASGAGGQHVNKTDSAVRITHLPTNTVVECQQERSQLRNREQAMSLLLSKLTQLERDLASQEEAADRKTQVGSGDRSGRIRTYNYPQGRMTDHRINLTLYRLEEILEGDLSQVIIPLIQNHQADELRSLQVVN